MNAHGIRFHDETWERIVAEATRLNTTPGALVRHYCARCLYRPITVPVASTTTWGSAITYVVRPADGTIPPLAIDDIRASLVAFGEKVRATRKKADLPVRALGELLGIQYVALHHVENGRMMLDEEQHRVLAEWIDQCQ